MRVARAVSLMAAPVSARLAKPYAIDDGGMVQLVAQDSIFGCQNAFKQATVCIETGRKQDCVC